MSVNGKNWQVIPLEDAVEALIDYRGKTPKKTDSGIPLITAKIVKNGRIETPTEFIADEDYDLWMTRGLPKVGDVVLTTEAPLGEVAQLDSAKVALAQRIVTLRGKSGFLDNDFLLYLIQSSFVQNQLESRASGSTVRGIKQSELRKVILLVPPYEEQKWIALQIKSLDKKIEINRQINQTLEQMAQAIFQSWFVDFEPVKAKIAAREDWLARQADQSQPHADASPSASAANAAQAFAHARNQTSSQTSNQATKTASSETTTDAAQSPAAQFPAALPPAEQADLETVMNRAAMCAISGKTDADLDAMPAADYQRLYHTASLFPDELIESELGEIPKGWAIGAIGDMLEFNPKRSLKKGSLAPYLDMKNVPTSGHLADEVVFREMGSGSKFINGDTLLARITPCLENGKTAFVDFLNDDEVGWGSTEFIVIRPKDGYPYSLGYLLARDSNFRQVAIQSMTGTSGRQRADAKALAEKNWVVYPKALMMEFGAFSESYLQLAKRNGDQISTLTHLRNSLLPKLLSGELDISALTDLADHAAEPGATHV